MTTESPETDVKIEENEWMIRPCYIYDEEYSECTGMKGRFHQYFIHGESLDCNPWKRDFQNCKLWYNLRDHTAFNELVKSEVKRRAERLGPHYNNTVWKKRAAPPEDWNKPLPECLTQNHANSYLGMKAAEIRGGAEPTIKRQLCTIS